MTRFTSILLLIFVSLVQFQSTTINAQSLVNLRSTLSLGGDSRQYTNQGHQYIIQQSIGQASVIDSYQANGIIIHQGFIQPFKGLSIRNTHKKLDSSISPNPFTNNITIKFSEKITEVLNISIYNLQGITIHCSTHKETQELQITLNDLTAGFYIIRVSTGSRFFVTRIIKI
jgi:hypothetical protein